MPHIQPPTPSAGEPVEQPASRPEPDLPPPADDAPTLAIADATAAERDGSLSFTVRLSRAGEDAVSVAYAAEDGTATAVRDYRPSIGMLTFAPYATEAQRIEVAVSDDAVAEGAETFLVRLSDPQGATLAVAMATGTIIDDDRRAVTIEPAALNVDEGAAGSYTVVLGSQPTGRVTVTVQPDSAELTVHPAHLRFTPADWRVAQAVTVTAAHDADALADAPVHLAHILRGGGYDGMPAAPAWVIIVEDEVPTLAVAAARATEGTARLRFSVSLSLAGDTAVAVDYATGASGDTATAGQDYTATRGTLAFPARSTAARMIDVPLGDDDLDEPDEKLTLTLRNPSPGAALAGGQTTATATGTIDDDDDPPRLTIADASVTEGAGGGIMAFAVALQPASELTVTVRYATDDGTAAAGADYTRASGSLTFEPGGPLTRTITVAVANDRLDELTEYLTVTLSAAVHATLDAAAGTATGTIHDDDAPPVMRIADGSVSEADGDLALTVTLDRASGRTVSVRYATADGTATAGMDYTAVGATLTFGARAMARTIAVPVLADSIDEESETFTVTLSGPRGVRLADATATGTIIDDDQPAVPPSQPGPLELASLQVTGAAGAMYPAFAAGTRHYALACSDSTTLRVTARARRAGARLTLLRADAADNHESTDTLNAQVAMGADHDVVIELADDGDTVTYAVHCLPAAFPDITILQKTDQVTAGLLLVTPALGEEQRTYMAVVDNNGVPRYHRTLTEQALNFQRHHDGRFSIARRPNADDLNYSLYGNWYLELLNERFEPTTAVATVHPLIQTDGHDFRIAPNGDYLLLSLAKATRDFSELGNEWWSTERETHDSVIQRISAGRSQKFSWNTWDHRDVLQLANDCRVRRFPSTYAQMNSLQLLADGDIVASLPGCAQVLRIDGSTGAVQWKLGGTAPPADSGTEYLEIVEDAAGEFCGQHHVTLTAADTVVMFDNGMHCLGPRKEVSAFSRAVEYDISSGTQAVFRREFRLPDKYGFFRFEGGVSVLGDDRWLISWGSRRTGSVPANETIAVSEVDPATGTVHLHMNMSEGDQVFRTYRAYRVSETDVDIPWNLP